MVAFFTKYPDAGAGKRRRQQALEVVNNNIKWIGTYSRGVRTWLETEGPAPWFHHRLPAYQVHLEALVFMVWSSYADSSAVLQLLFYKLRN